MGSSYGKNRTPCNLGPPVLLNTQLSHCRRLWRRRYGIPHSQPLSKTWFTIWTIHFRRMNKFPLLKIKSTVRIPSVECSGTSHHIWPDAETFVKLPLPTDLESYMMAKVTRTPAEEGSLTGQRGGQSWTHCIKNWYSLPLRNRWRVSSFLIDPRAIQ